MSLTLDAAFRRLGLPLNADLSTARARFLALSKQMHPDLFLLPADRLAATARFQDIAEAYQYVCRNWVEQTPGPPSQKPSTPAAGKAPDASSTMAQDPFSVSDLIGMATNWWEGFDFIFMMLMWPLTIAWGFGIGGLIVLNKPLSPYPRIQNVTNAFLLRWGPCLGTAWAGVALLSDNSSFTGWYLFASGTSFGMLELVAQVVALFKLSAARRRLAGALVGTDAEGADGHRALLKRLSP